MDPDGTFSDPDEARAYLGSLSSHVFRLGDTSFLHPGFAVNMANAVQQARAAGLPVTVQSGYRTNNATGSSYDAAGLSMHGYGAAMDVGGIGGAGSPQAKQWGAIAAKNGVYNPYGVADPREYNHWQAVPWTLESRPDVQQAIINAKGDAGQIWNAISPTTSAGASVASSKPLAPVDIDKLWEGPAQSGASAPTAAPAVQPVDVDKLWEGPATSASSAPAPPVLGSEDPVSALARRVQSGVVTPSAPVNDTVDPYTPISQQLATAGRNAIGYAGAQLAGVPSAVATDFRTGAAVNAFGNSEMNAGNVYPSFPSADPSTWQAGGMLHALGGVAGQVLSPVTGLVRQTVEQPVTQATGSPAIGEAAGVVANSIATPFVSRAVGAMAGAIPGRVGNAMLGSLDPETARLAQAATTKYGIPLTAPQLAPENSVTRIGSNALDRLPFSGAQEATAEQRGAWTRAVTNTFGEDAAKATPDVMNAARARIGDDFDTVAANTTLRVDPQFASDFHSVVNQAGLVLTKPEFEVVQKQAANIFNKIDPTTGTISGDTYQALTRKGTPLDALGDSENPNLAYAGRGLRDALDGMLQRSAPPQMQDLLTQARKQWAAMKTVQPLAAKAPTGDIPPALLAGRVNANTDNGMAFGWGGDLGELARIGQRFLKEPGSSNTTERGLTYAAIGGAGAEALRAATGGMSPGEMMTSAIGIPAGLAAARVGNTALKSQWLSNALINRSLRDPAIHSGNALSIPAAILGGANVLNKPINALGSPNP